MKAICKEHVSKRYHSIALPTGQGQHLYKFTRSRWCPQRWVWVREIVVRNSIVIREYKWCCPITLRATWFVCFREVTLSFSEQLSKLEGPSCGHLLPSQTSLANQEVFLVLTSGPSQHQLLQAMVSTVHLCQQPVKEQWGFPSPGIHWERCPYIVFQYSHLDLYKGRRYIF